MSETTPRPLLRFSFALAVSFCSCRYCFCFCCGSCCHLLYIHPHVWGGNVYLCVRVRLCVEGSGRGGRCTAVVTHRCIDRCSVCVHRLVDLSTLPPSVLPAFSRLPPPAIGVYVFILLSLLLCVWLLSRFASSVSLSFSSPRGLVSPFCLFYSPLYFLCLWVLLFFPSSFVSQQNGVLYRCECQK